MAVRPGDTVELVGVTRDALCEVRGDQENGEREWREMPRRCDCGDTDAHRKGAFARHEAESADTATLLSAFVVARGLLRVPRAVRAFFHLTGTLRSDREPHVSFAQVHMPIALCRLRLRVTMC